MSLYKYRATVRSVYDGDTIRVNLDLGFGIMDKGSDGKGRQFRLYGINTPELRGKEREEGLKVRDYVRSLIPEGTEIIIESIKDKSGKYGRYLGIVWFPDSEDMLNALVNLNNKLVIEGHAKEYMKD